MAARPMRRFVRISLAVVAIAGISLILGGIWLWFDGAYRANYNQLDVFQPGPNLEQLIGGICWVLGALAFVASSGILVAQRNRYLRPGLFTLLIMTGGILLVVGGLQLILYEDAHPTLAPTSGSGCAGCARTPSALSPYGIVSESAVLSGAFVLVFGMPAAATIEIARYRRDRMAG